MWDSRTYIFDIYVTYIFGRMWNHGCLSYIGIGIPPLKSDIEPTTKIQGVKFKTFAASPLIPADFVQIEYFVPLAIDRQ